MYFRRVVEQSLGTAIFDLTCRLRIRWACWFVLKIEEQRDRLLAIEGGVGGVGASVASQPRTAEPPPNLPGVGGEKFAAPRP